MKIESIKNAVAVSTTLTAGLILAGTTLAQTSSDAGSPALELDEVVVTARRVEERLQDVPISITVFNQEQLNRNNVTNAVDLANVTPSLSVNNNFGNENASFAIRGFVQDPATPPSVGTYFGDVVAARGPTQGTQAGDSAGPGSFYDLQNIQVLKGPQGTLQGRNTTGGAVLLVPQKPTVRTEGYAEVSAGNYGMLRFQGAFNLPLNDAVRFRIAADHQKRDGWLNNISGIGPDDYNNVNYTAVRASLVVDITPNLENYTIASYSKSDTHGSVEKLIAAGQAGFNPPIDSNAIAAGSRNFLGLFSSGQLAAQAARGAGFWDVQAAIPNPQSVVKQWQLINTTTWRVSDGLTIKNIASYAEFSDLQRSPLFGTNWQLSTLPPEYGFVFFQGIPAVFTGVFPAPGKKTADQSTYTEELQLQGSAWEQKLTYQGGLYFEWSDPLDEVGNQSSQLARCTDVEAFNCSDPIGALFTAGAGGFPIHIGSVNYTVGRTTFRSRGVYTQSNYNITDQLKLTAGARYTWDEQTNSATRRTYTFPVSLTDPASSSCTDPGTQPSCELVQQKKSSKPTWLVGLDYKPTEDAMLYGKYARGYRAGGVFTNAPNDLRTFNPEKVDNFEVGFKSAFRGAMPATFNIAAFYNNFSDQQLQFGMNPKVLDPLTNATAPVSPTTAIINAGKSRIYGAEVDASITPVLGLVFDINYTYLKTEIVKIAPVTTTDPNYSPAAGTIPTGTSLTLSPKNKYTLSGRYVLPLDKSIGDISVGATFIHVDKQLSNFVYLNPTTIPAVGGDYGTIDAYNLLNVNLGWASIFGSTIDVNAFGTNVTNRKYYTYIPGLGSNQSALEFAALGEPRMYGVRLRYRFGG